ncbi:MAG: hypothetical protein ABW208_14420 [Pyrinomonadaceae bacterium]
MSENLIRDIPRIKKTLEDVKSMRIGEEVPVTGEASDFKEGTPEHALAEFLNRSPWHFSPRRWNVCRRRSGSYT